MLEEGAEQNAGEIAVGELPHSVHGRRMNGAAAAGAHMVVSLARQCFGNLDAEGNEGLGHFLARPAADVEHAAGANSCFSRPAMPGE